MSGCSSSMVTTTFADGAGEKPSMVSADTASSLTSTFTTAAAASLFSSVAWESARFPERLVRAMKGFQTVFSAWEGDRLLGLIAVLDDGEMTAYIHYLLVRPEAQRRGIGSALLAMALEKYRTYPRIVLHAEGGAAPFYEKFGFIGMDALPMLRRGMSR